VDPGEYVTVNFALQNVGTAATTNLVATLLAASGVLAPSAPQNFGALATNGSPVTRSFSFMASGACGGTISPTLQLQDGTLNLGTTNFGFTLGKPIVTATQNFDTVSAPALPLDWTSLPSGAWVTTSVQKDTPPNSAFASNPDLMTDQQLLSPVFSVTGPNSQLRFRNFYDTEPGFDGGVLEISINGGGFDDILNAGGAFVSGGYNHSISTDYDNPLGGRPAWSGNSEGFVLTTVALPPAAVGGNVQFRWRLGTDSSISATGWYVDTVAFSVGFSCCTGTPPVTLATPKYNANNQFQFNVLGGTGYTYTILAASNLNLPVWVPLVTNTAPFSFTDFNAVVFPRRFYRARSQ